MITRTKYVLASWLALALAGAASALPLDPLGDPDQFHRDLAEINARPLPDGESLGRAVGAAVLADVRERGRCVPQKISIGKLEPVTLDGMITGMIAKGEIENAWLISVKLDDCPPADPTRVLLLRAPDGKSLKAFFAGQGESLAWPSLARDVLAASTGAVAQRLAKEDPQCKPTKIAPTGVEVTGSSSDFGPSQYGIRLRGSWNEVWTFEPCGHRVAVPIAFRTNGAGGAYWDVDPNGTQFVK